MLPSFETDRGLRWLAEPCADSALVVDANSGVRKNDVKAWRLFPTDRDETRFNLWGRFFDQLDYLRYVEDNGARFPSGVCSNEEELGNTSGNRGFLDERSS